MRTKARVLAVALSLHFCAISALAAGIEGLSITAGIEGVAQMTISEQMLQAQIDGGAISRTDNVDGTITLTGGSFSMPGMWEFSIDSLTFDPDPFISLVGGLTNLSGVAQDFFISSSIPILPVLPSSLIGGSTVLSYADANFDGLGGLTNNGAGASGYAGLIDGAEVLNLLPAFALVPLFAGDATQSVSDVAGLPGPSLAGPSGLLSIGVLNRFNLSPGDQATYNSTFVVDPIPEPGTAALLGLGLLGLGFARRR